eukprot:2530925-Pleurochrysis_carterae.AAC.4
MAPYFKLTSLDKDNGGEYLSSVFTEFLLRQCRAQHFYLSIHSTANGLCEHFKYTLAYMTRAILSEGALLVQYWPYCFLHVFNVCNRLPHSSLPNNTTPYQELTGHKPTHQQL